ncbi:MAG: alpha/beta hydrolase, partial [Planctomycetes bacterium]|nr:alpha/beta hydrolase [Planctomycetota bacterium]
SPTRNTPEGPVDMKKLSLSLAILVLSWIPGGPARAADEWLPILRIGLKSDYSQQRHDAVKQIDTTTVKGLRALWQVLESKSDPLRIDWYVREGAYEALLAAEGEEAEAEILSVLKGKKYPLAKEAIVYSVIWKIRKSFVDAEGGNDDRMRERARALLRQTRGIEYFKLMLPRLQKYDPEGKWYEWIKLAFEDSDPRVRMAALQGFLFYPRDETIQLLLDNMVRMRDLEKKNKKNKIANFEEWIHNRYVLEQLTGQYYRDVVEDWLQWWTVAKDQFSLKSRVEQEAGEDEGRGRTVVVRRGGVEVTVNMKIAGDPNGYPLLVLSWQGYEPEYFRPWFHGVEEFCKVYYLLMPMFDDFKGLARGAADNIPLYPTKRLAEILKGYMEDTEIDKMAVLGHGPAACTMAMMLAVEAPEKISHLVLISPMSAGSAYRDAIANVKRQGQARKNPELVKGADNILIDPKTGKPTYEAADAAESGGMGRALMNLRFADPTLPMIGNFEYLYRRPGGTQVMNDSSWAVKSIFSGGKTSLPTLIFMGEKNPWTPLADMKRVEMAFTRSWVARMASSSEFPFASEPYEFTRHMEHFFTKFAPVPREKEDDKQKQK